MGAVLVELIVFIAAFIAGVIAGLLFISWRWNRMVSKPTPWPTDERP